MTRLRAMAERLTVSVATGTVVGAVCLYVGIFATLYAAPAALYTTAVIWRDMAPPRP